MTERLERITPEMSEEEVLGVILDEIMARAKPDVAEAIRFCAIPHWFDEEILAWLRGEGREPSQRTQEILAALTELTFVGPYHDRGYAYHENVRDLLLHRWRQEEAERFQELSGLAAAYYADKLGVGKSWLVRMADKVRRALGRERAPTDEQRNEWQREEMYHLLVADEERGFDFFMTMFNRARRFYQLSTCDLLLDLAEEQEGELSPDNQPWLRFYRGQVAYVSALWDEALEIWEALEREDLPKDLEGVLASGLGSVYHDKGEWDKAIDYYQCSLEIKEKVGDEHEMAPTLNNLGEVYRVKGEWDKAIKYYQRSLEIAEKVGDEHGMSAIFNNLGLVYKAKGEWDTAVKYYQRSLEIAEKVGDEHGMAPTFNNLGSVYQAKGEWDKAIEYYQRDLAICEKVGDEHGMAPTFNNLGSVYQAKGEWDKATEYYQRSLAILEKVGDEQGMATTFNNLGSVYHNKGEWDKAIEYYQRDLAICEKVGDEVGAATTMYNIALFYEDMERYDEAVELLEKVVRIDERVGHPKLTRSREALERIRKKAG